MVDRANLEKDLQQKLAEYRIRENRVNYMSNQRDMLAGKLIEVKSTLNGIGEILNGNSDMIFHIGSGSYVKGKLNDTKILVDIGANVILTMTIDKAESYLKERQVELEEGIESINKDMEKIIEELRKIDIYVQKQVADAQKDDPGFGVVSG